MSPIEKKKKKDKKRDVAEESESNKKPKIEEKEKCEDTWWATNKVTLSSPVNEWETYDSFDKAGFSKRLAKYVKSKFDKPTPIQAAAWPLVYTMRKDVIGIAKTGSGKTLAFAMPYLALSEKGRIDYYEPSNRPRMLALAPTRELAIQIQEVCKEYAGECKGNYPAHVILGGVPKYEQKQLIRSEGIDICVATPGRLMDLCNEEVLDLSCVQFLVLDEADRMLDMGFIDEVKRIVALTPGERQTVLFSATWPDAVNKFSRKLTKDAVRINVGQDMLDGSNALTLNEQISHTIHVMADGKRKYGMLTKTLDDNWGKKILVFALYKKEAAKLEEWLCSGGYAVKAIQGDMTQDRRTKVMEDFKSGKLLTLVATDVAARGLDIPNVDLVINYTFPLTAEDFVHRCGRTARGGKTGRAITYFNESGDFKEKEHAFDLCRLLKEAKQQIPTDLEELSKNTFSATKKKDHPVYGKFFKSEAEMAKLEAKKVHTTFADSDDE
eukprot:GEMP01027690.1.p1 GENE.GEMP01027690.1~~GEMP01027690.1.p1  ORF type:complete len:495 (+),score=123.22 GEMP01027690.1:205-1689(+)